MMMTFCKVIRLVYVDPSKGKTPGGGNVMMRNMARPISFFLIFPFLLMGFSVSRAQAAMVGTEAVLNPIPKDQSARIRLYRFLDRQNVLKILKTQGISAKEAKARIASLSETEAAHMAAVIDRLPAGGDGVGALIGAALFVFIVLLITDILGLTHVFPFVYHHRK
jgi:Family of unknown function (DUF6627)